MKYLSTLSAILILSFGMATIPAKSLSGQQTAPVPPPPSFFQSNNSGTVVGQTQVVPSGVASLPPKNQSTTKTIYKVQQRVVRVFNPAVGRYESQVITERVPVEVSMPTSGGSVATNSSSKARRILEIENAGDVPVDFYMHQYQRRLNPKSVSRIFISTGQQYWYSAPPREVSPGRWVGGGTARGVFSANQTTLRIGGSSSATVSGILMPTTGVPAPGLTAPGAPAQGAPTQGAPTQGVTTQGLPSSFQPGITVPPAPGVTVPPVAGQNSEPVNY